MKSTVKTIVAGICTIILGVIILIVALAFNGWTLKVHFTAKEFTAEQENSKIVIESSVGSVKINYYDGEKVHIYYPESKNYKLDISEDKGTVKVKSSKPKWYEFSLWWSDIPEMTIDLPKDRAFELDLTVNAGTLRISEGQYSNVRLTVNAGTLTASKVECDTFRAEVNAGSMQINGLVCSSSFRGEVNAGSMSVKSVACPKITAEVSAGSLNMAINGSKAEYNITVHVSAGSSNIKSKDGTTDKTLKAEVSAGSLNVTFTS